jgi:hypothetical protein
MVHLAISRMGAVAQQARDRQNCRSTVKAAAESTVIDGRTLTRRDV